jgi:class 3 adenylate cyclase
VHVRMYSVCFFLRRRIKVFAEDRGTVSVIFCDVYDFHNLVWSIEPLTLVTILDNLFKWFDRCADQSNCQKIETVAETYLSAAGLRPGQQGSSETPKEDAFDALRMGLSSLAVSQKMLYDVKDSTAGVVEQRNIRVKIGIHSGRVISGVVGAKKPQYALFGDTVNTASRMKTTGKPDYIHVSAAT